MPAWTLIVSPSKPVAPVLIAPKDLALTNDDTPELSWQMVPNGESFRVQIDNNSDFTSPVQNTLVDGGLLTHVADPPLDDGKYFWRVRAINGAGAPGAWSVTRTFTVDTTPPPAPVLVTPIDGARSTNVMLKLDWKDVETGARYELWLEIKTLRSRCRPSALGPYPRTRRPRRSIGAPTPGKLWRMTRRATLQNLA